MSKRGWGPELFGLFDSGRIEECVDGKPLSPSIAFDDEISSHVAKAHARFHSLDLPFEKHGRDPLEARKAFLTAKPLLQAWLDSAVASEQCKQSYRALLDFPLEEEFMWASSFISKIQHRKAFCSIDANYCNRLLRNDETVEHRCYIIDYDISCWYDRGFDLSCHFLFRLITVENRDTQGFLTGLPYPSREERKFFLARYLEEASNFVKDFQPDGLDSVDHLLSETDVYALIVVIWQLFICAHLYVVHEFDPHVHYIIDCFLDLYRKLKDEFVVDHPEMLAD